MADDTFSLEEIKRWHTPKQVLDLLPDNLRPGLKREEIAHRMQAGTIRVGALRMKTEAEEHHGVIINPVAWAKWAFLAQDGSADGFWEGASFHKFMPSGQGFAEPHLIQFFGVRLHSGDIATMFAELGLSVSATSPPGLLAAALDAFQSPPVAPYPASTAPKPALSDAHLRAWWAFYVAVTTQASETEENAIAHVARCFPSHSVSRPRIRQLRGKGKRGPKPQVAE